MFYLSNPTSNVSLIQSAAVPINPLLPHLNSKLNTPEREVQLDKIEQRVLTALDDFKKLQGPRSKRQVSKESSSNETLGCIRIHQCLGLQQMLNDPALPLNRQKALNKNFKTVCRIRFSQQDIMKCAHSETSENEEETNMNIFKQFIARLWSSRCALEDKKCTSNNIIRFGG